MKSTKLQNVILIILLSVISFGIYINSLGGDFLIDDQASIVRNEQIHDLKGYFSKYFRIQAGVLPTLISALFWRVSAHNPYLYHLFNVVVHVCCVILIFILCNILFKNRALSFFSSLIFAIHPIHTEAVSWISGGHYALSSLFFIASFIFYVKSDESFLNLALSVVFFSLCFFAGNAFVVLPVIFILYDLFFREGKRKNNALAKVRTTVLFLILAITIICVGMYSIGKNKFIHMIFQFRGFHYLIVSAKAFLYYLKILYLPLSRGLYHPFAFNVGGIQNISPAFFLSIAILAGSILAFFKCRRNLKPVSFGIMWFFVAYAPYSNIVPICNIISERYLYLASVGFSIIMAGLFLKVWDILNNNAQYKQVLRFTAIAAITLFLSSYATLTLKRNCEYSNIITYWESNIRNFEDGHIVYNNLARTYYMMGNIENAIAYCWVNLLVDQNQPHVWCNLGKVYREKGDLQQAEFCYQKALEIDKGYYPASRALKEIEIDKDG